MGYFVVADDGQKYGPADIATLNGWITEGRILQDTLLEGEGDGQRLPARMVSGLNFAAPPSAPGPYGSPGETPFANYPRGPQGIQTVPKGFNWGAFTLNWIWGANHKKYILLLMIPLNFIPFAGTFITLGMGIWAGMNGNQWAWESGRFSTVEQCMECQRVWKIWGISIFVISIVLGVVGGLLIGMRG